MDIKNAKIDVLGSVGSKLLLIDVIPSYAYVDGRRTSTVTGYKYIVILEENKFDRLSVRTAATGGISITRSRWSLPSAL